MYQKKLTIVLNQIQNEKRIRNKLFYPLSLGYLSSYLYKYLGNNIEIFIQKDINNIFDLNPDIIGISCYTENFLDAIEFASQIKKKQNIPIILGGHHITSIPETLPPEIDIGIIGEGEETLLELIHTFIFKNFNKYNLNKIPGIVFHDNKKKIITKTRKIIEDIDTIPLPNRKILSKLFEFKYNLKINQIHTTRGCPYKCSFCSIAKENKRVRFHSPERILSEIEDILRLNLHQINLHQNYIIITDNLFTFNLDRLYKIVDIICENKINQRVYFSCQGRANIFNREIAKLLKKMNVRVISFGFESYAPNVLKYLKGNSVTPYDNQKAVDICFEEGILCGGYFILGSPVETKKDLTKTYWFINRNRRKLFEITISYITPYPATKIWEDAKKSQHIKEDFSEWDKLIFYFQPDISIFMNRNYSIDYFTPVFYKFKKIEEEFKVNNTNYYFRNLLLKYEDKFYNDIFSLIPSNVKNVLNFSIFGSNPYLDSKFNTINVALYSYQKINETDYSIKENKVSKFDLIVYNNVFPNLSEYINNLKEDGYLLWMFFNIQNIKLLKDLLFNNLQEHEFINYYKIKPFFMSYKVCLNILKKFGFNLINKKEFIFENTILNSEENFNIIKKYINIEDYLENSRYFYYVILGQKFRKHS